MPTDPFPSNAPLDFEDEHVRHAPEPEPEVYEDGNRPARGLKRLDNLVNHLCVCKFAAIEANDQDLWRSLSYAVRELLAGIEEIRGTAAALTAARPDSAGPGRVGG